MQQVEHDFSHKKVSLLGLAIIIAIFGVFGFWAIFTKVDLSVRAPGEVIVQSYKKEIKHPKGGTINKLWIHEGEYVTSGKPLIQLDTAQLQAQLQGAKEQLQRLTAQKARIEAEIEGNTTIHFPQGIDPTVVQEERAILKTRIENLKEKIADLRYQIQQLSQTNKAIAIQLRLKRQIAKSYEHELAKWQELLRQGLADELKINDLQRRLASIRSEINSIQAQIAQNRLKIAEYKNKIALLQSQETKELREQLKNINAKLPQLRTQIAVLEDEIKKSTITAPASGYVVDMKVHSPGEVITPHRPILYIVPKNDRLIIEAHISPLDIDKVHVGQEAEIHFAPYVDPSAKPVKGKITYVSADIITDPAHPQIRYYKALVQITPEGMRAIKENGFKIVPGMPVTVFIKAGKRSFLSYILIPVEQLMKGAFHAN